MFHSLFFISHPNVGAGSNSPCLSASACHPHGMVNGQKSLELCSHSPDGRQPSPLTSPLLNDAGSIRTDDEDEVRRKVRYHFIELFLCFKASFVMLKIDFLSSAGFEQCLCSYLNCFDLSPEVPYRPGLLHRQGAANHRADLREGPGGGDSGKRRWDPAYSFAPALFSMEKTLIIWSFRSGRMLPCPCDCIKHVDIM